ncbi:hypothetical protein B0H11DRAFT_2232888 [Mycena galericulata]|nr:hypothetical protein B0H11DRAFT_2232888 [Mycena galericulata]
MTQTPPAAGTGSVPAAAFAAEHRQCRCFAIPFCRHGLAFTGYLPRPRLHRPQSRAPAPAAPVVAAPAPAGFLTQGPWVAGRLYVVVPSSSLLPIAEAPPANEDDAPTWYCITKGRYVGVTLSNSLAVASIVNISGG